MDLQLELGCYGSASSAIFFLLAVQLADCFFDQLAVQLNWSHLVQATDPRPPRPPHFRIFGVVCILVSFSAGLTRTPSPSVG